jgi:Arc/MetJ-type ribon-helix-helix transcriptional regulator
MQESGKEKITFRVSKDIMDEIDAFVNGSNGYANRSDFIRDVIRRGRSAALMLNSSSLVVHSKVFEEMLRLMRKEDIDRLTRKTSSIVNSYIQERKGMSLDKINGAEALEFVKEVYESTNIVKKLNYKDDDGDTVVCVSGENLQSKAFCDFICAEVENIMRPWFKLKSSSGTMGNLVLVFE